MKPSNQELILFKTVDGVIHIGSYMKASNKWECELFMETFYDRDVVEWWHIPENGTGVNNKSSNLE